jgi:hypothetical protein
VHQQQQWIYHNSLIHFKVKDRLTIPEHHDIINRVESCALTDPDTLLPRHRFLDEADFDELASGPTSHRLLWLADMDTAIAASSLAEDVLGRRLKQLGLAIEPFCSSLEPSGHRGTHCRGAVDALESSVIWLVIPVD